MSNEERINEIVKAVNARVQKVVDLAAEFNGVPGEVVIGIGGRLYSFADHADALDFRDSVNEVGSRAEEFDALGIDTAIWAKA